MQVATFSAIFAGISAAVAVVSAVVSGVSAVRSRSAKREAEQRAREALEAAQSVATGVDRIAQVHESRQLSQKSAEAEKVTFAPSPVMGGRTGWRINNDSNASISDVRVRTTTNGARIVVYHGSSPDPGPEHVEPVIAAHQPSKFMFRPEQIAPDKPEVDQMVVAFTDAKQQRWERTGGQAVRAVR
jgi:hypothetical protein